MPPSTASGFKDLRNLCLNRHLKPGNGIRRLWQLGIAARVEPSSGTRKSGRFKFEPSRFTELRAKESLSLPVEQNGDAQVEGRIALLKQSLDEVDGLAARGEFPDAAVSECGLKISPLTNTGPEKANVLMRCAYALLPQIKITDLLLEVDHWTGSSKHFTHLKPAEPAKDKILLLTAILADGINLGISKMA